MKDEQEKGEKPVRKDSREQERRRGVRYWALPLVGTRVTGRLLVFEQDGMEALTRARLVASQTGTILLVFADLEPVGVIFGGGEN